MVQGWADSHATSIQLQLQLQLQLTQLCQNQDRHVEVAQLVRVAARGADGKVVLSSMASSADAYRDMNEDDGSTAGIASAGENRLAKGFEAQPEKLIAIAARHNKII